MVLNNGLVEYVPVLNFVLARSCITEQIGTDLSHLDFFRAFG